MFNSAERARRAKRMWLLNRTKLQAAPSPPAGGSMRPLSQPAPWPGFAERAAALLRIAGCRWARATKYNPPRVAADVGMSQQVKGEGFGGWVEGWRARAKGEQWCVRREGTFLSVPLSSLPLFFRLLTQPALRERGSTYRLQAASPRTLRVCVCV